MLRSMVRALRWFVGVTLVFGGLALAAGARIFVDLPDLPSWTAPVVLAWIGALAVLTFVGVRLRWPWPIPASLLVLSLMAGVLWARFDPTGHDVLSGLAPFVAVATGVGMLLQERWAWPVAFASVTGFGPIILLFAPLPDAAVYGAFALFVLDAVVLLALLDAFFERS